MKLYLKVVSATQHPIFFGILALIYLGIILFSLSPTNDLLLELASSLIAAHVILIGWLFAKEKAATDIITGSLGLCVLILTALLFYTTKVPHEWYVISTLLFLLGTFFHLYNIRLNNSKAVKEMYFYKLKVDLLGLLLSLLGLLLILLLPRMLFEIKALTVLTILLINTVMFLYHKFHQFSK
ncbi:MAG: hypothetical protein AABY00_02430 [Nanoarchaeota archaeon]